MVTYQDLLAVGEDEKERADFVLATVRKYKSTDEYATSRVADDYFRQKNTTINQYQKLLYTLSGQMVPDNFSANYKLASNYMYRLIVQQVQFLLGNGVSWSNESTAGRLGKDFDVRLQELAMKSLKNGVAFGFFNYDHLEVFDSLEFCPLYDEENGALMAGIRFWQIDNNKPFRATLYEVEGISNYKWVKDELTILSERKPYKTVTRFSEADGIQIYNGENYETFPIVPLWGNPLRQSELVGMREHIDAYDLVKSGFANDLDDASQIYWIIQNAGGMDDVDLVKFVEHMKTVKAAVVDDDGAKAEAHTIEVPFQSREALLSRIEKDMYRDFMGVNTEQIAAGQVTATQIEAAYDPLNAKTDQFEYCVIDFIQGMLSIIGIEDDPTFNRSIISNKNEELQNIVACAEWLDAEYVTEKVMSILGDADKVNEVLRRMQADEVTMMIDTQQEDVNNDAE